jgi:hypothetical protein
VDSLLDVAKRGLTMTLGIGVLVVQHAQVQRQELARTAPRLLQEVGDAVGSGLKALGEKVAELDDRADDIFDDLEQHLPEALRATARQTHAGLRELRQRLGSE